MLGQEVLRGDFWPIISKIRNSRQASSLLCILIFQTLPHLQSNISQQTRCSFQSLFFVPLSCTMCPLSIPRFNFSTSIGRLSLRTKVPLAIATGTGPDALHTRWETTRWMIFTSHIGFVVLCVFFSAQNCTTSILQYLSLSGVRITD